LGNVEEFIRANKRVWEFIENSRIGIPRLTRIHGHMYELVSSIFRASVSFTRELVSKIPSLSHLPRASLLGLHAVMYQYITLVLDLVREDTTTEERYLAEVLGMSVDDLRNCLLETFKLVTQHMERATRWDYYREACSAYWKRGALLPHLGALLINTSENPPEPAPRPICVNALVPWILGVIRDLTTGSIGAGAIGILGASIGRGKTTTIYYTLRTILYSLNPTPGKTSSRAPGVSEEIDELVSKLILLDAEDFLDTLQALSDLGVKAPILVVDNASVLFPKQWIKYGGTLHKFFLNMNTVIDLLRGVCGAVIFVANAPGELASFIRNTATLNISGREETGIKTYSVTVYTWKRPTLRIRSGEETVRMKEKIASVYAYPLLKLPQEIYKKDLQVKVEIIKRKTLEATKTLREKRDLTPS